MPGVLEANLDERVRVPVSAVEESEAPVGRIEDPPEQVLGPLDQRQAFTRLREKIPPHLQEINFDFEAELWTPADIDALCDLLCATEDRFSKHATQTWGL